MAETENVSKKLIEDAEQKRKEILDEANAKAQKILKDADEAKKEILKKSEIAKKDVYKREYDFLISQYKSQLNQKLLSEKIQIVEEVIKKIMERLENLNKPELKKALLKFADNIKITNGVYLIGKNENNITDSLIGEIFGKASLTKSKNEPNFSKGFKIIDGRKEYYFSEKSLFDPDAEDTKMEISKLLFE
jgi:V/A-type H+-transporting ATPase subunit E